MQPPLIPNPTRSGFGNLRFIPWFYSAPGSTLRLLLFDKKGKLEIVGGHILDEQTIQLGKKYLAFRIPGEYPW